MIKYIGSLYVSNNKETTINFYKEIFGFRVIKDFGSNFTFTGGLCFQTKESWSRFIDKTESEIHYQGNDGELYIETDDLDNLIEKLKKYPNIQYVHHLKEHEWGQRGIRFYDPDFHIIEVSETLPQVCLRFSNNGLTVEEISKHMGLSEKIVERMLKN